MNNFFLIAILASLYTLHPAYAETKAKHLSVDASKFDIADVKLGMGLEEAIDAFSKKLKIKREQLRFGETMRMKYGHTQKSVSYRIGKDRYYIVFQTNVYNKTPAMIVTTIMLTSKKNRDDFTGAILAKYGNPSKTYSSYAGVWCEKMQGKYDSSCRNFDQAILSLQPIIGLVLKLRDNAWDSRAKPEKKVEKETKSIF